MELDGTSDTVMFTVDPQTEILRFSAQGMAGDVLIEYPNQENVIDRFTCEKLVTSSFKTTLIQMTLKALGSANKVCFKLNAHGILSLQVLFIL